MITAHVQNKNSTRLPLVVSHPTISRRSEQVGKLALWSVACYMIVAACRVIFARCSEPLWNFWGIQDGGDQLVFATYISKGFSYFTSGRSYPLLFPQTPGLFPLIIAPFVKLFGPKLLYGNLLGALSFFVTMASVAWAAFVGTRQKSAIALSWIVMLTMPRFAEAYFWNRPDSLCAALSILSLALLVKGQSLGSLKVQSTALWSVSAGLTACLACFAKQVALPIVIVIAFYLLASRKRQSFLSYGLGFVVPGFVSVVILERLTHGAYLYNVLGTTRAMTVFSAHHWAEDAGLYSVGHLFWLLLGAWCLDRAIRKKTMINRVVWPMLFAACFAGLLCAYGTCWHTGGSLHYFLNGNAFLAVTCAVVTPSIQWTTKSRQLHWTFVAGLLVLAQAVTQRIVTLAIRAPNMASDGEPKR